MGQGSWSVLSTVREGFARRCGYPLRSLMELFEFEGSARAISSESGLRTAEPVAQVNESVGPGCNLEQSQ